VLPVLVATIQPGQLARRAVATQLSLNLGHQCVLSGSKHVGLQAPRHQQCLGAVGVETKGLERTKQTANNLKGGTGGGDTGIRGRSDA
jgi:hypothetical protein